jgi:hypothetical protein
MALAVLPVVVVVVAGVPAAGPVGGVEVVDGSRGPVGGGFGAGEGEGAMGVVAAGSGAEAGAGGVSLAAAALVVLAGGLWALGALGGLLLLLDAGREGFSGR